jgi:hypothetical protein
VKLLNGNKAEYYQIVDTYKDLRGKTKLQVKKHLGTIQGILKDYEELERLRNSVIL